ncbi:TetR/AcrR family transcriptional regulator C-terminal domain-containing protein [Nonomuraea turcica]|uniref:TetR/AcrR family transcriptional regulator C-terminal domain-containing protein n=1 Tax=Nonomuraea sp. G32 TaxID=3067274 RepID=UPI0035305356
MLEAAIRVADRGGVEAITMRRVAQELGVEAIRARAFSARAVLSQHSWALGLMDSRRNPGPATLRHHDAVLGVLRRAGFTLVMAAHAVSLIDSYISGFVLQEPNLPLTTPDEVDEVAGGILEHLQADELPYLTEMIVDHALQPGYDDTSEFGYGPDLILDALEARRR